MIKNPKIVKRVVIGSLTTLAILSGISSAKNMVDFRKYADEYNNVREEIEATDNYKEELLRKKDEIYQKYREGQIEYSEFNNQMNNLLETYPENFDCVTQEQKEKLEDIHNKEEDASADSLISGMAFALFGGAALGLTDTSKKRKIAEDERSM